MPTIKDIAAAAGVTVTTVSRVLNNHPYVSEEKRQAVREAIKRLNYIPNASAVNLKKQKTNALAVILPIIDHPFFGKLIEGMSTAALEEHYHLILCQRENSIEKEQEYLNMLKTKQVDGIVISELIQPWDLISPITQYGPVVLCHEYELDSNAPSNYMNHYNSAYDGMKYLVNQGYSKIAICIAPPAGVVSRDREKACRQALEDHGMDAKWVYTTSHSILDGEEIVKQIIQSDDRPDAIFTGSDQLAAGIMIAAAKVGLDIPGDLAVLGFDNQPIAHALDITTIDQPARDLGYRSVKTVISLINGNLLKEHAVELPYTLVERKST
ncbi:LacI family DNA-binding transcriptional regulator [Jeotgalibacillus salarius]|uniref:LacI family transcriptional regulator n=1 Tax=Jeotgalibacillus salarius TaxID=546023 RepID=A0A4Y8LJA1_9BACL|nr:LacI family DNA-binding transcriptional regulator [Jeotgalibacillus salarius]TFE00651.1 LacI family transcriptional regulator [Jeotgalibacillus salarius]